MIHSGRVAARVNKRVDADASDARADERTYKAWLVKWAWSSSLVNAEALARRAERGGSTKIPHVRTAPVMTLMTLMTLMIRS